MDKKTILTRLAIVIAIVIVGNVLANSLRLRLDFTADQRYTLSKATKDVLAELNEVVTVKAYFTEDVPVEIQQLHREFKDLLIEYENRNGNIYFEFIDPTDDEALEQEAQQVGIMPRPVQKREGDKIQEQLTYLGVLIELGEGQEVLPAIVPNAPMEYLLTRAIKKLSVTDKPAIAFLQGHGEPTPEASIEVVQELSALYNVEPYTISATEEIPGTYKAVAMINPTDTFSQSDLGKLDNFMAQGGGLYVAYGHIEPDLSTTQVISPKTGLDLQPWLAGKGVTMNNQLVVDVNCDQIAFQQQTSFGIMQRSIRFPYFPIIQSFADHPISAGIEVIALPFAASMSITPTDSAVTATVQARSSEQSGLATTPAFIDVNKQWTEEEFDQVSQPVAVALEGPVAGSGNSRMVVVPNGKFGLNGTGQQQNRINPNAVTFVANAIDWVADNSGLMELRGREITSRPIDELDDSTRQWYKIGNVTGPILLILIYALVRNQRKLRKRQQWLEGNY